jgi:hypothetical protein
VKTTSWKEGALSASEREAGRPRGRQRLKEMGIPGRRWRDNQMARSLFRRQGAGGSEYEEHIVR